MVEINIYFQPLVVYMKFWSLRLSMLALKMVDIGIVSFKDQISLPSDQHA